jgi:hypothetical protein
LHYLITRVPSIGQGIVDIICSRSGLARVTFIRAEDHPWGDPENKPDFRLVCEEFDILCEHKLGSDAETGASADADLLLPFLVDARAALRRAAVLAIVRLTAEKYLDRIVGMLRDPAASVVKQAARSLRPYADFIGGSKLIQLFETAEQSPSWLGALSLIASLSKWDALLYLLRASRIPDENRTKLVEGLLVRWNQRFNLVPIHPSSQTIGLIQDELDQRRQALPQERAKFSDPAWLHDLRFTLRSLANE